MNNKKWSCLLGSLLLVGPLLGASSAQAESAETDLPRVASTLSTSELAKLGSQQDRAEIAEIISMAGPEQNVQALLNFDTGTYDAAVLVDETPEEQLASFLATKSAAKQPSNASGTLGSNGVYTCSYTSSPKGTSYHTSTAFYWCGSGYWTGSIGGWFRYRNGSSKNHLVGPSSTNWMTCPPYTTCDIAGTTVLGYVSFS